MKTVERSVKLKKEEVGPAQIPILETEEDLQTFLDEKGIDTILKLINTQRSTNICNAIRAEHRESTPGKGKRYNTAFNVLPEVTFNDGKTGLEKLTECVSLPEDERKEAMDALLMSSEVQKAVDEKLASAA